MATANDQTLKIVYTAVAQGTQVVKNGEGYGRFSYHVGSYGAAIGAGALYGGPTGFGVSIVGVTGEMLYDCYNGWAKLMSQYMVNLENGMKNGYVPGRR